MHGSSLSAARLDATRSAAVGAVVSEPSSESGWVGRHVLPEELLVPLLLT
jgi:hypothetical protein